MANTLGLQSIVFIFKTFVMITTSKSNELTIHSQVIGGEVQVWREVHLEAESPYFMVVYSVQEMNCRVSQTCLIWRVEDLICLCDQIDEEKGMILLRVCLLSPPWMNGSKLWRIDQIHEIWNASHQDAGSCRCFILEDSTRLIDSRNESSPEDWKITDSIFLSH